MGTLEYNCINSCIRCKGHRLCPLVLGDTKALVARLNQVAKQLGEDLPNAHITIDCHDFDPVREL